MLITGRPEYTDEQYRTWLDDMRPFLKLGCSLYYAMDNAMLLRHKDCIYEKYRLNDWFSEKIDAYRRYPGEIVNSLFVRLVMIVDEKIKRGASTSDEEWRNIRFFSEKHRSCQPFFVTRQEVTQSNSKDISKIIDRLEEDVNKTDYENVAESAKRELDTKLNSPV